MNYLDWFQLFPCWLAFWRPRELGTFPAKPMRWDAAIYFLQCPNSADMIYLPGYLRIADAVAPSHEHVKGAQPLRGELLFQVADREQMIKSLCQCAFGDRTG